MVSRLRFSPPPSLPVEVADQDATKTTFQLQFQDSILSQYRQFSIPSLVEEAAQVPEAALGTGGVFEG
jgi:hypothetical protein